MELKFVYITLKWGLVQQLAPLIMLIFIFILTFAFSLNSGLEDRLSDAMTTF